VSSAIKKYYEEKIEPQLQDKKKEQLIYTELSRLVTAAYDQNIRSDEGFCFKFSLPQLSVGKLYTKLNLNPVETLYAFKSDWGQVLTEMHKDKYYQILLLLVYHGIIKNNPPIASNALMLITMKIWNGRMDRFFPSFCNKNIMKYVVSSMMTNRHGISKYENPTVLLKNKIVPKLLETYSDQIKSDPSNKLKRLFEQSYARIYQLFVFNNRRNLKTKEVEAQGGILPLYMKAYKEGLYIKIPVVNKTGDNENPPPFDEYSTTHNRDDIVQKTVNAIVMNSTSQYPNSLIQNINTKTKVSSKIIEKILHSMHNNKNYEILQNLIVLILSRTNVFSVNDICSGVFSNNLQKNVISSKNNEDVNKIQKLLDIMLTNIFREDLQLDFNVYSNVQKIKIRSVILFGIEYNLFRVNCKGQ